jgi:hypothetical protein
MPISSEMIAIQQSVRRCETEKALGDLMERLKADIACREGTEWAWAEEQKKRVRKWCREAKVEIRKLDGEGQWVVGSGRRPTYRRLCDG